MFKINVFYVGLRATISKQNKLEERRLVLVTFFRFTDLKAKVRRQISMIQKDHESAQKWQYP